MAPYSIGKRLAGLVAVAALAGALCCAPASAAVGDTAYQYDALGRVISATTTLNSGAVVTTNYTYDAAGNRTSIITQSTAQGVWGTMVWGASNW